jgi:hypothetical protein
MMPQIKAHPEEVSQQTIAFADKLAILLYNYFATGQDAHAVNLKELLGEDYYDI